MLEVDAKILGNVIIRSFHKRPKHFFAVLKSRIEHKQCDCETLRLRLNTEQKNSRNFYFAFV